MSLSFQNPKRLRFVITLGTGRFGSSNNNQITLEGYRATVEIDKAGLKQQGTLRAQIFGMSRSDMNAATVLQWKLGYLIEQNQIDIYAIDGEQTTLIFSGNIVNSWGNYAAAPNVFFEIQGQTAYHASLIAVSPRSFEGSVDLATIAAQISASMGKSFQNFGVRQTLSDIYLPSTDAIQLKTLCDMAIPPIDLYVDDKTVSIAPKGQPAFSKTETVPEVSAASGLKGYPTFDGQGVTFDTVFNPAIQFGGLVKLTSELKQANEQWVVLSISHRLQSETPRGVWFSTVRGIPSGVTALAK